MKKKISLIVLVLTMMVLPLISPLTISHAKDKKVIRVAYPLMQNVTMKDEDGNYYGYDYEYLKQIAQYTGWEYEFVEVEGDINTRLGKLLEMLKNGEVDLFGSMTYSDELAKIYDYASEPYGYSYEVLAAKKDSDIFDQNSLISKKNIRVAVHEKSVVKAEKLKQFASMSGFTYEEIRCKDTELYKAIDDGKADAVLTTDMSLEDNYRVVSKFFPSPFYFATTKGNSELISQLNKALVSISETNPTFSTTLYNRYFTGSTNEFMLNNTEKTFIKNNPVLNVLVRDSQAPVQYTKDFEVKGVAKDILDILQKHTGVRFEYTIAKDYKDFKKLNESAKFDILIGLPYEMNAGDDFNVNLTNPFFTGELSLVANNSVNPNELKDLVEGKTPYSYKDYNTEQRTKSKIYESPEEILLAIEKGEVDYAYLNSYIASYYMSKNDLNKVTAFAGTDYLKSQYSYGVKKSDSLVLLGILNKVIISLDGEMNSLIYKNANIEKDFSVMGFIQDNLVVSLITLFLIVVIVIAFIHRYYTHQLKMKRAVELEYKRYQMLYELTGEMTFSYNYLKDELKISQSGLNKLAKDSIIGNFSQIQMHQETNQVTDVIYQYLMKQVDVNCELELTLVNNEKNWYQLIIKIVNDIDKNSQHAVYAIGKVLDIQKDKVEKEKLKQSSMTDSLTGIYNRAGVQELVSQKLLDDNILGGFIMLDLDNFKEVNDQYGHLDGDIVLQQTADLLSHVFENSIVARLGGDEFVIFTENINKTEMADLCIKALNEIEKLPYIVDKDLDMTMSMGVVFTDYSRDFETLMKYADEKLYEVKRQGKNGYMIY